ncbi:restriction endonuclease subunit S [Mobilitalea sibirica]|uniref:Restriction endonuclease subunit S n=1 Tax=Mobilitalea sibirica TaxID=1462919 RepID=A0A8J7HDR7_9FIRM|nr:restriction endonuclease subunit S [Mobilitalea sibirica]MBH1941089.1 restriction endonuclease subunit S [Mobilitalea sibirica]
MSKQIREGYKMTELGEIPVEWEVQELSEILEICYGKSQKEVECNDGIYKILGTGGVIGYTNEFLWDKPSVLIGRKGTIDKPQYIEEPFWTVDTLFYTKIKNQNIAKWIYYYLNNIDLKRYNEATGVPSLSVSNLNKIRVSRPTVAEQKKIVEIISTVDNQIENTDGLIEKTKELKKGLMQRLLTKGIGHTEFKMTEIGKMPKGWEVKTFKDISKVSQGLQIAISERHKEWGENRYLYLTIQYLNDVSDQNNTYYIENPNLNVVCRKDDILMTRTGNTGIVVTNVEGAFHNNFFKIDFNRNLIDKNFLVFYLKSDKVQNLIKRYAGSTTIPDLNHGDFYKLPIVIPSMTEQQKIASVLLENDNYIREYKIRKEKLQMLKKGLMQQLLTGKKRVIV